MRYGIKGGLLAALLSVFMLALANPINAQTRTMTSTGWKHGTLSLYAGGMSPTTHVGTGEFDPSATVGATLGFWVNRYAGIRVNGLFARTDADGPVRTELGINNPNIWMYDGDIVLRAPMSVAAGWISPYILGGLGGKTYDFRTTSMDNKTYFAGNFGAGLEYRLPRVSRLGLSLEVRDFVSKFDMGDFNSTQHDVVWTGGIRFNY